MISIQGQSNIVDIRWQGKEIVAKYMGDKLVWGRQSDCCFSNGYWVNAYPWRNDFGWKNNV